MWRWLWISALIILTPLSVHQWDYETALWFAREENAALRRWGHLITDIALGEYWFGLALIIYIFTRWMAPRMASVAPKTEQILRWRNWSVNLFLALLGAGVLLQTLKATIGRQRPYRSETFDPLVFEPLNTHWHFHSMPSGHTQVLFTVATVAILMWPRAANLIYALAAGLAFTRVMTHQHFLSDVFVGAAVGVVGASMVLHFTLQKWPVKPRELT